MYIMQITFNKNFKSFNTSQPYFQSKVHNVSKAQLEALVNEGTSVDSMCKTLKISTSVYYDLLKKFNIVTPRKRAVVHHASITKDQILDLISSGKKYNEIIEILGVNQSCYNELLSKFGIVTNLRISKNNIANITKDMLQSLVDSGKKVKIICAELQIPERTYSRLLDKFGIQTSRKLAKQHVNSITREMFMNLFKKGLSKPEICNELKITESMFYKLLKRLEIPYEYTNHAKEVVLPKNRLEELVNSGKTTSQIAEELGVSVTTFHEKAKLAKVKTEYRDSIDKIAEIPIKEFQNCLNSGMYIDDICKKFNISKAMYSAIIRKYNLTTFARTSHKIVSEVKKEQLLALKNSGKTRKEICKELSISESSYTRIMKKSDG